VRARRCGKVRGIEFCGYCAAKKERFFGWRMHLVCTPDGIPVRFVMLPAAYHDLTPIHELLWELPGGVWVVGDKGYISGADTASILEETGVRLIAAVRKNMRPNSWEERVALETYRHTIETVNSQLERMGFERLYARTNEGFEIKAYASLLALASCNIN
jgi:IS5 family transposase